MTDSITELNKDQMIHMPHNLNIMQQIKNDMIINRSVNQSNTETNVKYYLDNETVEQAAFLSLPADTIFYINKIRKYDESGSERLQTAYKAYTPNYYKEYRFEPKHFDLSFDESDQLVLEVTHPMQGELYAYGIDKNTAKQGVKPYQKLDFRGSFLNGQNLLSRQIDEMRFVLTIADSIYIHDFKIEDFYTHDH